MEAVEEDEKKTMITGQELKLEREKNLENELAEFEGEYGSGPVRTSGLGFTLSFKWIVLRIAIYDLFTVRIDLAHSGIFFFGGGGEELALPVILWTAYPMGSLFPLKLTTACLLLNSTVPPFTYSHTMNPLISLRYQVYSTNHGSSFFIHHVTIHHHFTHFFTGK